MRSRFWHVAAVMMTLFTAACSSGSGSNAPPDSVAATGFPVQMTDCAGTRTTFTEPPRKIVTSDAAGLEILLELGAGDRVIGTGYPPGKGYLPDVIAAAGAAVPVLGQTTISKERLLGSNADLFVDTFGELKAMGDMGILPSDKEFAAAGIKHLYLLSTACAATATAANTDLSAVEQDLTRLGAVTGTRVEADRLVATMTAETGAVGAALAGLPADKRPSYFFFDFDAGTEQSLTVCNRQIANAVITLAGARNIYSDCDSDFKPVSWEDVVARNPDWIQLGVRNKGSEADNRKAFDAAEHFLRTFPATAGLAAVRQGHLVRIGSEVTTIAGVRNADTVRQIASIIHPDLLGHGR